MTVEESELAGILSEYLRRNWNAPAILVGLRAAGYAVVKLPGQMTDRSCRQMALWPITTRSIPPYVLMDGAAALRSGEVRGARRAMTSMEFCARHIEGWPNWPGDTSTTADEVDALPDMLPKVSR